MENAWIAMAMGIVILVASMASVELGISVALIEIVLGVVAANGFGLHTTPWIDFLASFASIVLTFLAGAEVDPDVMQDRLRESLWIGGISFLSPFWAPGWRRIICSDGAGRLRRSAASRSPLPPSLWCTLCWWKPA